jgi:DNA-binding NarL/FixJ family response regulator
MSELIGVVEAAYRLEDDDETWLTGLGEAVRKVLDDGFGVMAWMFDLSRRPEDWLFSPVTVGSDPGLLDSLLKTNERMPREDQKRMYLYAPSVHTSSQTLGVAADRYDPVRPFALKYGFRDFLAICCLDASVGGCVLGAPLRKPSRVNRSFVGNWGRVSAHIAAGLRLRRDISRRSAEGCSEAIVDLSGKIHHAEGEATTPRSLDALRDEARRVDRARGKLRRADPEAAVRMWRALVAGQWSLIDRFESDGRHLLVARRNEPNAPDPRALNRRERVVARYVGAGHSNKLIAYTLGVSEGSVSASAASVFRKLGVRSRTELIAILSDRETARSAKFDLGDGALVVHSRSGGSQDTIADLTKAENEVARFLVAGKTNAEIASLRSCSPRTVAVIAATIYRKLGVRSRSELAVRLGSRPRTQTDPVRTEEI